MPTSPENLEQTVANFAAATNANRQVSSRSGNVVELSPENAQDVMVTADLHGNRLNFDRLLSIADLDRNPRRHLVMQEVCHGGPVYPSGEGCMSHLLLEDVAALKVRYPDRFHFLLSNHEWAELTDFPITKSSKLLNLSFRCGLQAMYGDAAEQVRDAYVPFLASCPLAIRIGDGVVVCHSAPERVRHMGFDVEVLDRELSERDIAPHGDVFRMLWGRDFSPQNGRAFAELLDARVLIHGHEPCETGFAVPNEHQVILDCCGHHAKYVILPTAGEITHGDVVNAIHSLHAA